MCLQAFPLAGTPFEYCYKHFSILSIQELTFDPGFHRGRRQTRMVASILFTKFDTGVVVCVLLFLFVSPITSFSTDNIRTDPGTGLFIHIPTQRVKFFHGVNVVSKIFPFLPDTINEDTENSLTKTDMSNLHNEWGFNAVRLGVMWVAVEPTKGAINSTYLQNVRELSDLLFEHGLYTLVDGHQDVLGPDLCGEGFPLWAVRRAFELQKFDRTGAFSHFPLPWLFEIDRDNITGFPERSQCVEHLFIDYYSSFGVSTAFGSLYKEPEMYKYFASYWQNVASTFSGAPGLLAYEILNEPGPGDVYDPLYWPSDRQNLFALYNETLKSIRQVDDDTILFFEGVPTSQYIGDYLKGSSDLLAPEGPGGVEYGDREAFAFHLYCPPGTNEFICDGMIDLNWEWLRRTKARMKTTKATLMTEFGAVGNDPASIRLLNKVLTAAEALQQSWFYWTYRSYGDITTQNSDTETFFFPNGSIQSNKIKALSTTYPQSVAGVPSSIHYYFDRVDSTFGLHYITTKSDCGIDNSNTTEIYLNEAMWYSNGYVVNVSKPLVWKSSRKNYIEVEHPCGVFSGEYMVYVKIYAK